MREQEMTVIVQPENAKINVEEIPKYACDSIFRAVLDGMKKAFANPKFAAEYEEWLATRNSVNQP